MTVHHARAQRQLTLSALVGTASFMARFNFAVVQDGVPCGAHKALCLALPIPHSCCVWLPEVAAILLFCLAVRGAVVPTTALLRGGP